MLADCKQLPHEAGYRLILADWLEENGSPLDQARADLIRAQLEYERLPPEEPTRNSHGRRMRQLQQRHGKEWLGPLAEWTPTWACLRGLFSVSLTVAALRSQALSALATHEAWAWVEQLCIQRPDDADIARLAGCPLLVGPCSLVLMPGLLGPAGAQALARSPWLANFVHLDLNQHQLTARGFDVLLRSEYLGRLRQLDLAGVGFHRTACHVLGEVECATRLERLTLWGNGLGDDGAEALAAGQRWAALRILDLRSNAIGNAGARALATAPRLHTLRTLNLADNLVGPTGAAALAGSPYLEEIESLVLWGNPVGAEGARLLTERFGARVHVSPMSG